MPTTDSLRSAGQLPREDAVFLDHIGWFVDDPYDAARALEGLGFAPTPVSVQVNPDPAGGPDKLTGTGNVCVMLERGYLEFLFKTADTPLGQQFDEARARYAGAHLAAFAIDDPVAHHARLAAAGFTMQPIVDMKRPVETETGPDIAGFEVVRVAHGAMPEGRIQMLRHVTESTVWQSRWLTHPNGAWGLADLTIVVADIKEAAERFARFLGTTPETDGEWCRFMLDRGSLSLTTGSGWQSRWPGVAIPDLPFMAECTVTVHTLATARTAIAANATVLRDDGAAGFSIAYPGEIGLGVWTFRE